MMSMPIAVQLYSVRKEAAEDLKGTLKKVKEMGYDGVEFAGLNGLLEKHTPAEIRNMCEELSLVPISAHIPYADLLADTRGVLGICNEIGFKFVVFPWLALEDRPESGNFNATMAGIAKISAVAKEMGIRMLYHNHEFEFVKIDGKYALDVLYEKIPADLLGTEIDTCWANVGGEDPAAYVRKYAGRAPIVHLKDFFGEKSENMYELIGTENKVPERPQNFEFRPLGKGVQNFPAIIEAAKDAGAEWLVVEQDKPSMGLTAMESIEESRNYLRSIGV